MKLYISYYGDYISIVEGEYRHKKEKYYIDNINFFSINDVSEEYKEKYGLLRYALENIKYKSKNVVISLNTRDVILKQQRLPSVSKKDLEGIMSLEVDEMMSLNKEEYIFSYEVTTKTKELVEHEAEYIDMIIGAIKKEEVHSILDILSDLNLQIDRIDTLSTAYLRFLSNLEYEDMMVANIGDNSTIINIYKKDSLFIYDNIPIKITPESIDFKIFNVVEEAKGLMNYYSSRNFGKIADTILILGQRYRNKAIHEALSSSFAAYISQGITGIVDVDDIISGNIDEKEVNLIIENLGSMLDVIDKKDYNNINLLPEEIKKKQDRAKKIKSLTKLAPIAVIVAMIPYIALMGFNKIEENKLHEIENQISNIESTYHEIGDIEKKIDRKKEEINIYNMISSKKVKWGSLLSSIDKSIPYRVELTNLTAKYDSTALSGNEEEKEENKDPIVQEIEKDVDELNKQSNAQENNINNKDDSSTEIPLYDKVPNILTIEGNGESPSHVAQFVYNLNASGLYTEVKLHNISESKEDDGVSYKFSLTLYLKKGVLNNE